MTDGQPLSDAVRTLRPIGSRRLRPWTDADADRLVAAWLDPEVARWNPVPDDPTPAAAARWIARAAGQTTGSAGVDLVMVDDRDVVLGEIGLQIARGQRLAEVGFWVGPRFRRTGVARDMLDLVPDLLELIDLDHGVALVDPDNTAAIGLVRAAGWREVATTSDRRGFAVEARS